jgi:hypothetical protein
VLAAVNLRYTLRLEKLGELKSLMNSSGIEAKTFGLIPYCLNEWNDSNKKRNAKKINSH